MENYKLAYLGHSLDACLVTCTLTIKDPTKKTAGEKY